MRPDLIFHIPGVFKEISRLIHIEIKPVKPNNKVNLYKILKGLEKLSKLKDRLCNFKLKGGVIENTPKSGYIEGLVIQINQDEFPKCCRREGYYKGNDLITYFSDYNSIGEGLWNLYQESMGDDYHQSIREYRKNLRKKIYYTSSDYIPHPLDLKNLGYAITFLAPGTYGMGNIYQKSRKIEEGIFDLMDLNDVLKRNDLNKSEFLKYTLECMHGGVHGINIRDIIDSISENSEFLSELQKDLTEESINKEKNQFANTMFGSLEKYEYKFGSLDQNLRRSTLKLILGFGNKK